MKLTFKSDSPNQTVEIAKSIGPLAKERKFVSLSGPLGAGKTAFAKGIVACLCPECINLVHSPTFAIVNEYMGKTPVFHFDFYRIKSPDDLYSTGFYDYEERNGVIIIEWGELFEDCIPEDAVFVEIIPEGENRRTINITYKD
ncbi:MAG: tRNA (adenosine(37)-N6)-threonylcarbamoyltransferase complex ATPase subunit type 1 TsaE [Clostridiales bacterium]|jgi:tRNA threonylcarbamoyladenosine biosynthesis protein TsaE|nr:tRNA (adenosine(37)-N6)-threonylcarbamoyltransferase complex ATPase subunit type 1 TsaE [Clostridiales bacterium]